MAQKRRRTSKQRPLTARNADKHVLYQLSVQDADSEVAFVERVYKQLRGRAPESLREDFCGTALLTATWAKRGPERRAIGVDIDPKVLAWGKKHNVAPLGDDAKRVTLLCRDVRAPAPRPVDVVGAFNFSYWVFKTREELADYFRRVHRGLTRDGLFFLDAYGGWEAHEPMLEKRPISRGFTYVWDQHSFDPITHRVVNHIHFRFRDGSKLERAFTYDWRFWTLPELGELLREAGFRDVAVYWDTSDDDDVEAYRRRARADNQPAFLTYLVAVP